MKEKAEFRDLTLKCVDCGQDWIFSAGEQFFYQNKGLHTPLRCPACRKLRKLTIDRQGQTYDC
jgi:ssDNA-binding Zn-finger/Zn-ribbon topoisomerase 1